MVEPGEFLLHASVLVRGGSEVDARRALSAAYYGVFHSLAWAGAGMVAHDNAGLRAETARAFEHTTMLKVCRDYALPANRQVHDLGLINIANLFIDLQAARHEADYDLTASVSQIRSRMLIRLALTIMNEWPRLALTEQGKAFLLRLLLGPRLGRRG